MVDQKRERLDQTNEAKHEQLKDLLIQGEKEKVQG